MCTNINDMMTDIKKLSSELTRKIGETFYSLKTADKFTLESFNNMRAVIVRQRDGRKMYSSSHNFMVWFTDDINVLRSEKINSLLDEE